MKDAKHIRRDFHSATLVKPQDGTLGRWGAQGGGSIVFKHGHVVYQMTGMTNRTKCERHFHPMVKLVTLG